jgi:hypothetical protein
MVDKAVGVLLAIVTLASVAVILSKKSDTGKVLTSFFTGFTNSIRGAVSPVTGA